MSRHVLVTGAARGIGRAIARRFAEAGDTVWMADRDERALDEAASAIAGASRSIVLDVTDEGHWGIAREAIEAAARHLDVLVNNAGVGSFRALADLSLDEWRRVRAINCDSLYLGSRAMMPLLARSGGGAIVNIGSIRGMIGASGGSAYSAAKGAARMFGKARSRECAALGYDVRVNTINPGLIDTPLARAVFDDPAAAERRLADIPLGRAGEAEDIADAAFFLAGAQARYMTGAEITIDGGQTAG